jgi:hypothetical protein
MDLEELLAEREKSDSIRKKFSVNNVEQFFEGCGESPEGGTPPLNKARSQLYKHNVIGSEKLDSNSL